MSNFWSGRRVLVTGGAGFVGSHVVERLVSQGAVVTVADRCSKDPQNLMALQSKIRLFKCDLSRMDDCLDAVKDQEIVINLAARVAGVAANSKHPATMFRENVIPELNLLEAARQARVERFEVVSSACVYRRDSPVPTAEEEGFIDHPEPSNFGYGWAKRIAEVQAMAYAQEYGMAIGIVRPYNAYGPRDHFQPNVSHVIPALIRRIFEGENPLRVWGNGRQSRSFLYVEDFARGVLEATEHYPKPDPINLGTKEEIQIKDLVQLILELSGRRVDLVFDTSKPAGQPRRNCDTRKAKRLIGFQAQVPLREGLARTLDWYREHRSLSEASHAKN